MPKRLILWVASLLCTAVFSISVTAYAQTSPTTTTVPPADNGTGLNVEQTSPDIVTGLCQGVNLRVGSSCASGGISDQQAGEKINDLIRSVINIFSLVVGVVAVIMIIIGGLKYITSGGDSSNVSGAKNTILYAIIGLVIVALAQVIVRFVLGQVTQ